MLFLIEYDRAEGRIVRMRQYDSAHRRDAEDARLKLELELNGRRVDHEVVLLEAASEVAVRKTHRRYFESLSQITTLPEDPPAGT